MADSNPENDDNHGSQSPTDAVQPSMTIHPMSYPGMPMHMYPFPPGMMPSQPPRTKRRQVKNACTNCQKACKKCDDARPCLRCVKYGIAEECVDSQRKERQKGIKRGPYKKRDGKYRAAGNVDPPIDVTVQSGIPIPTAAVATASATPPIQYVAPMGYPHGFYPQYPTAPGGKPGEAPLFYPQVYFMPPMPPHNGDGEAAGYPQPIYAAAFINPYAAQAYGPGPYMMPHPRPDGQMAMAPTAHYLPYPQPYPKPPTPRDNGNEMQPQAMDPNGRRDMRMDGGRMGDGMQNPHGKSV